VIVGFDEFVVIQEIANGRVEGSDTSATDRPVNSFHFPAQMLVNRPRR
jgi:hypothetical protein